MAKKSQQKTTTVAKLSNYGVNRIKRLARHLKKHPQDMQAQTAIGENKIESTRKKPNAKLNWMSTNKTVDASLRSKFIGTITKANLVLEAQILKFVSKAPYHALAVFVPGQSKLDITYRNLSKLSNFKGKIKKTTVKKEAVA